MERQHLESSLIKSVGYDLPNSLLELEFRGQNRVYQYFDVPLTVYSELMEAESKGLYFNESIKDLYVCQEVDESP